LEKKIKGRPNKKKRQKPVKIGDVVGEKFGIGGGG